MMMSDLTEDLVEEILTRVPARSLKRLRSTSKQWNALFHDHRFTKKHFEKAEKEFLVLMWKDRSVYSVDVSLGRMHNNVDRSIALKGQLDLPDYRGFKIIHCNGLLLWSTLGSGFSYRSTLIVYNPCTGQTRWIKAVHRAEYKGYNMLALGYKTNQACCDDSYKILKFGFSFDNQLINSEIYEFNSNSWRVLDDIIPDWYFTRDQDRGVSFKGNTYWIASADEEIVDDCYLLRFDFTQERFQRLNLPFECDSSFNTVVLSTVKENLAVLIESKVVVQQR